MTDKNTEKFEIKSTQRTAYRRGWLVFPSRGTLTKSFEDLSEEQWDALHDDPRIVITPVEVKAKKGTKKSAATKRLTPPKPASEPKAEIETETGEDSAGGDTEPKV